MTEIMFFPFTLAALVDTRKEVIENKCRFH